MFRSLRNKMTLRKICKLKQREKILDDDWKGFHEKWERTVSEAELRGNEVYQGKKTQHYYEDMGFFNSMTDIKDKIKKLQERIK